MQPYRSVSGFGRVVLVIVGLLLSAVLSSPVCGQQHLVEQYAREEGLPESQVFDVVQGSRGYLWLGLDGGAARFDGRQFKTLTMAEGLISKNVVVLHVAQSAALWVGRMCDRIL